MSDNKRDEALRKLNSLPAIDEIGIPPTKDHGTTLLTAIEMVAINVGVDDRVRRADLRRHAEALIADYRLEREERERAWDGKKVALARAEKAEATATVMAAEYAACQDERRELRLLVASRTRERDMAREELRILLRGAAGERNADHIIAALADEERRGCADCECAAYEADGSAEGQ